MSVCVPVLCLVYIPLQANKCLANHLTRKLTRTHESAACFAGPRRERTVYADAELRFLPPRSDMGALCCVSIYCSHVIVAEVMSESLCVRAYTVEAWRGDICVRV